MATKFTEIYELFLPQIDDFQLVQLDDEEIEIYIEKYLINGLITVNSSVFNTLDVDIKNKTFKEDLPFAIKLILAKSTKLEWLKEKKYSEELMRKSIGDRDYKAVQGTDYLKQLTSVEKNLREEIERDIIKYSYSDRSYYGDML